MNSIPPLNSARVTPVREKKVLRKQLADVSGPTTYEDLSTAIRAGMITLGYDLVDPLGIALDLREEKVGIPPFSC